MARAGLGSVAAGNRDRVRTAGRAGQPGSAGAPVTWQAGPGPGIVFRVFELVNNHNDRIYCSMLGVTANSDSSVKFGKFNL